MKDPLFVLIIGNVSGDRKPNDPNQEWGVVSGAVTRTQARECKNPKPVKVREMTSKMAVDKELLVRLQKKDFRKFKEAKETEIRK